MAYEIPGFKMTLPAVAALATDLTADGNLRYRFVSVDSSGTVDFTAAGDHDNASTLSVIGVMQTGDAQTALDPVEIMVTGVSKVEAGTGGVTTGLRQVTVDGTTSAGRTTDVTNQGDNQVAVGIALQTVSAGELYACLLMTPGGDRSATS